MKELRWPRIVIEILLILGALAATVVFGGQFLIWGDELQIPPDVLMVNDLSCVIHKLEKRRYKAICTASYLNHDHYHHEPFIAKFPEEKSEKASYRDTVKWRNAVLKIQAAAQTVSVPQLKKEKKQP